MNSGSIKKKSELLANKKYNLFSFYFLSTLSFFSLITSLLIISPDNNAFLNVYFLPLATSMSFFLSALSVKNLQDNIIKIIVYLLYFVRNVLSIYLLYQVDFRTMFRIDNSDLVNKALLLMIFETITVFILLAKTKNYKSYIDIENKLNVTNVFKLFLLVSTIVCIICYMLDPIIRQSFTSVFSGDITSIVGIPDNASIYFRIFNRLFSIVQFLVPLYLISFVRNRFGQVFLGVSQSLLLSISPMFLVSSASAYQFVMMVALMIIILKIYPKYRQILFISIGLGGILFLTIFILQKLAGSHFSESTFAISEFFQSYFPGLRNIIGGLSINPMVITIETLKNELVTFVPLRQYIFDNWNYIDRAIHHFQNAINNQYQIMANISIGHQYIGYLAPLLSTFMIFIANKFYYREPENIIIYGVNVFIAIFFAVGPIMLNITNVGARFAETFIWILLIAYFSDKRNIHKTFKL